MIQRDDKSAIPFPRRWVFPGGEVESGESASQAALRELTEELEYQPPYLKPLITLHYPSGDKEYYYYAPLTVELKDLVQHEGMDMRLYRMSAITKLDTGWWHKELLPVIKSYIAEL